MCLKKWQIIDQLRATEREQELCNSSLFSSEHFCHRYRFLPLFPPSIPSCQSEIHFFCYQVSSSPPSASSPPSFLSRLGTNVFTSPHRTTSRRKWMRDRESMHVPVKMYFVSPSGRINMSSQGVLHAVVSLLQGDANILFQWPACQLDRTEPYTKFQASLYK